MSRTPRFAPLFAALLAVTLAGALTAAPARAGFGDLVKKAKDKAAGAVVDKAAGKAAPAPADAGTGPAPEFDEDLIELDAAHLDQVLAGMKAGEAVLASRAPLVEQRRKLDAERSAVSSQYGDAIEAARSRRAEVENCWREDLDAKKSARDEAMQQRVMSDPALREKIMSLSMELAQAQAAGDAKTVARLQGEMLAMSAPTKADTLAAQKKCGALPPAHPMAAKLESLQQGLSDVDARIRDNDQKSIDAQVEASRLTQPQFSLARERLLLWYEAVHARRTPRGFSAAERSALDAKRTALEAALAPWAD